MNAGQIVRAARQARQMRLVDLGEMCGYSAAQISRLERGQTPLTDITLLRTLAEILDIPPARLGLASDRSASPATPRHSVRPKGMPQTAHARSVREGEVDEGGEDDPVRRREFLGVAGVVLPAAVFSRIDDALALMPPAQAPPSTVAVTLARARRQFSAGQLGPILKGLPHLLSTAHEAFAARPDDPRNAITLAAAYDLGSEALYKAGQHASSRITADRATTYAKLSEDPAAMAMAARSLGTVLRNEGRKALAEQITMKAALHLDDSGTSTPDAANALAQIYCTSAYSAAQAGDADTALTLIREAERAARSVVPRALARPNRFPVDPAQVRLYELGVRWALDELGEAMRVGRTLRAVQFDTRERRARLYTDLGRVWWRAGKPDQTAAALLAAHRQSAAEIRRPSIHALAQQVVRQHPRARGADQLALTISV
ncbi:helix-turn-helix transcriptional regulator [Actinomadura bangladeshensis]